LLCLLCVAVAAPAAISRLSVEFGRIEAGPVSADGVAAILLLDEDDLAGLRVFASGLSLGPSLLANRLEIRCARGTLNERLVACPAGEFRAGVPGHGDAGGQMSFSYDAATGALQLAFAPVAVGQVVIEGALRWSPDGWEGGFTVQDLDLASLRGLLEPLGVWPAGYVDETGKLDLALRGRGRGGSIRHADGIIRTRGVGFYGANSAEDLALEGTFDVTRNSEWSVRADLRLARGALYVEPGLTLGDYRPGLAIETRAEAIRLGVDLDWDPADGRLRITRLDLVHPGVVEAHAAADLAIGEHWTVHAAEVTLSGAEAGALYATYLQPFLLNTRFSALQAAGGIEAAVRIADGGLHELDLHFTDVHAYDASGRFAVAGLNGALRVNAGTEPAPSNLSWQGIGVYRLQLGAGELGLSSRRGDIEVAHWRDVPILDGALHIDSFRISNAGRRDMSITLDGALAPISMADLTQALGWPVMSGRLTGEIDGLSFGHGRLIVDGRIHIGLFDGTVIVRNLRVDDLFGLVPALHADVDIHDLDLAQLTDRFSFGRIEGRLGGRVRGLELQAWQPVYFEAELATPEDDDSRHRISQRAVDNLGFLGGGASGAVSGGLLRYFQDYSYGRIGIGCRLYNGACELGGVESTEDGFLILTRGGLLPPWIEVRGTGRSIRWTDLVEGLKAITTRPPEIRQE